mmetsp:Transcript_60254/g.178519  ORF Transcript_60254/g.178519 Transcript_60254/m.178519 type:complete len:101 (-) Transcript_60254:528-830(-)
MDYTSLPEYLRRSNFFSCLTYVLEPRIQDGKKIPKWLPQYRQGRFLGFSPKHYLSIELIFNPRTGNASPQCHMVYTYWYTKVPNAEAGGDVPPQSVSQAV